MVMREVSPTASETPQPHWKRFFQLIDWKAWSRIHPKDRRGGAVSGLGALQTHTPASKELFTPS
jgi:hypothetical protein